METEGWPRALHRALDRVDRRFGAGIRHSRTLAAWWTAMLDAVVARQADRRYMRETILPALARVAPVRLLFVGVRGYTRGYPAAFAETATEFWTSDIDPAAAVHGVAERHITTDVRRLDAVSPPGRFDAVILNGVFGWGVDAPADMDRALAAIAHGLSAGGLLLIGWNHDRSPDPDALPGIAAFEPATVLSLPHRKTFDGVTHVYAWYRRRR